MRVRSGGHDYEGLSYSSTLGPFILLDLFNLRSIGIDVTSNTAWVQSGATLGELYHAISEKAGPNVAFPAGVCPTVGIGGHLSGGVLGTLVMAFRLAADQVTLVQVPPNVMVFSASRTLNQGATKLVTKWQNVAYDLDGRLFIRIVLVPDEDEKGNKTVKATFNSLFLGSKAELLPLMGVSFPELGLREEDCAEMSWIKSVLYFLGYLSGGKNESVLTERGVADPFITPFKAKSDFVRNLVSEQG
ncbi:uncharacterized protein A4U43_C06F650 [Asparagus officinalis]|uniref:FAD-binding PCMH-type domain-containing protein n=1 Tax=Asparagus officinalis TaxID=4686 RepID=A0A5P1ELT8_ASPOF|nr:uncharacterized protein A4U43_C06F650 [Asparagus officinalis]